MMNWPQLLSLRKFKDTAERARLAQDELRLGFEVDYDRVIFSKEFRSLQDKTQVVPTSRTGFVHTRLTHSLEVSVVGRSLGRMAGDALLKLHPELIDLGYKAQDFGAIVAAASLAHDIGNPPFGHSGEKAIGQFFKSHFDHPAWGQLTSDQQEDLLRFEGNANGYRLLNQSRPGKLGGLRLTYATLGAFMKYPKGSLPHRPSNHISQKKFGYFQSEQAHFEDVALHLGLKADPTKEEDYYRHPLAYLVEAADDICYTIIDFEDGINLGWISEDFALEYLINLVRDTMKPEIYSQLERTEERLNYLRSLAINTLIRDAVAVFIKNEPALLRGEWPHALMDKSKFKPQIEDIIKLTVQKVYKHQSVLSKEIGGYHVLHTILKATTTAVLNEYHGQARPYDRLILDMCGLSLTTEDGLYDCLMKACGYVASLTDSNAIELSQNIHGFR